MQGSFLKSKEVKRIVQLLNKQWGFTGALDYIWFQNNKRRLYIVNKDFALLDQTKLRISTIGLYFGEITLKGDLRLSIEGSQIIGPDASRQILELNDEQLLHWLHGDDVAVEANLHGFYLLMHNDYFLGCGSCKDGTLVNFVPKNRRIKTLDI